MDVINEGIIMGVSIKLPHTSSLIGTNVFYNLLYQNNGPRKFAEYKYVCIILLCIQKVYILYFRLLLNVLIQYIDHNSCLRFVELIYKAHVNARDTCSTMKGYISLVCTNTRAGAIIFEVCIYIINFNYLVTIFRDLTFLMIFFNCGLNVFQKPKLRNT